MLSVPSHCFGTRQKVGKHFPHGGITRLPLLPLPGWPVKVGRFITSRVVVQFEAALKRARLRSLRKKSILRLFLGGAALQRCGKCIVLTAALAAEGRQFSNCTTTASRHRSDFALVFWMPTLTRCGEGWRARLLEASLPVEMRA